MRKELVSAYVSLTRRNAINARKRMQKTRNGAGKDGWSLINVKEARKELDEELLREERRKGKVSTTKCVHTVTYHNSGSGRPLASADPVRDPIGCQRPQGSPPPLKGESPLVR